MPRGGRWDDGSFTHHTPESIAKLLVRASVARKSIAAARASLGAAVDGAVAGGAFVAAAGGADGAVAKDEQRRARDGAPKDDAAVAREMQLSLNGLSRRRKKTDHFAAGPAEDYVRGPKSKPGNAAVAPVGKRSASADLKQPPPAPSDTGATTSEVAAPGATKRRASKAGERPAKRPRQQAKPQVAADDDNVFIDDGDDDDEPAAAAPPPPQQGAICSWCGVAHQDIDSSPLR